MTTRRILTTVVATACVAQCIQVANAETLTFNKVVADVYHAPVNRGGVFRIVADGVINTTDSFRGFDTFNTNDVTFAGLIQTGFGVSPQVFDTVTLNLGNQFFDGGDFLTAPNVYLLLNNVDTNTALPGSDANWIQITDATLASLPGNSYTFTLNGAAAQRTGYGFAIGGVFASGTASFLSVSELSATGTGARTPMGSPVNLVASTYHSPDNNRAACLTLATDGRVSPGGGFDNAQDFDTWEGAGGIGKNDFAGLLYSGLQQFDTVTLSFGTLFGDGGRFSASPRLFLNTTGVDTNTADPVGNPNWLEVTTGTLIQEADGVTFDLTNLNPALRQGYGWAIGGVDGNGGSGSPPGFAFISVSELSASGTAVPEPTAALMLGITGGIYALRRRRGNRS